MTDIIFKWPPPAQLLKKSKNFSAHQIGNYLEIILGTENFEKGFFEPELQIGHPPTHLSWMNNEIDD